MDGMNTATDATKKHTLKKTGVAVLCIVLLYLVFYIVGIGCPIKFFTGVSCAGCGMTRAWISCSHFEFKEALSFHPLFFMPPLLLLLYLFRPWVQSSEKRYTIFRYVLLTTVSLLFIIYLLRLLDPDNHVVVFEPSSGAVFRFIRFLFKEG